MSTATTGIAWCDRTWNPTRGCSKVSPGCKNCYAMGVAARFSGMNPATGKPLAYAGLAKRDEHGRPQWTGKVALVPEALADPLRWKKPARIFVNSMSDLFHESLTDDEIAAIFGVMAACPQHTFQVLTKRADRMARWFNEWLPPLRGWGSDGGSAAICRRAASKALGGAPLREVPGSILWPLRNVWIGVSVEDQQRADERIPHLLRVPAAVRFLSVEPLLGPVDLDMGRCETHGRDEVRVDKESGEEFCNECAASGYSGELSFGHWLDGAADADQPGVNWAIVGGESGAGARPMDLAWARSIVAQCKAAGVSVFVKQLGSMPHLGEVRTGEGDEMDRKGTLRGDLLGGEASARIMLRDRKGGDPSEWPADLRVRQFPEVQRG